jgi:hypothetical protein
LQLARVGLYRWMAEVGLVQFMDIHAVNLDSLL